MTTVHRADPWRPWQFWTWVVAGMLFLLWLLICVLGLFRGSMAALRAPSINALTSSTITGSPLSLTGLGTPNSKLQLKLGNKTFGPIAVGADGTWKYDADVSGLNGSLKLAADALNPDGMVVASSSPLDLNLNLQGFDYPGENEKLNAQDYNLSGVGTPGQTLEVWQTTPSGTVKLDTVRVGTDGRWNAYVPNGNPGTKPGTYTYELRRAGTTDAIASRTVVVEAGLTDASNARCPCRLRIFTNRKQNVVGSTIILFKDGQRVGSGTLDKLFTDLSAGEYTYTVTAPNYADFTGGKASLPRNKNFEVYLTPRR